MNRYKSKLKISILAKICWMALFLTSCSENLDPSGFTIDVPVSVESFRLHGTEGEINHQTGQISLTLPYRSEISAVVPEIGLPEGARISPALDSPTDFGSRVDFKVINGNLYSNYRVNVKVLPPFLDFSILGVQASIDDGQKSISLTLPADTDVSNLQPEIELSEGVSISPQTGSSIDFSNPVVFTVSTGSHVEEYTATVTLQAEGVKVAYLGLAANRNEISDPDEKEAGDWVFNKFSDVEYLSFRDIANGKNLAGYSLIWWHFDAAMDLPEIALESSVLNALKSYRASGGSLLLTTFASRYVEALDLVPMGKGPNNVFGDFPPNGFVDQDNSWGISFRGHEDHPVFQGLQTFEEGKANLLEKGTFRLNHTAWWFLPEWGGYGDGEGWRNQTGGINLASEAWDNELNGRVLIAEFPGEAQEGNVMVISAGAYDWYQEDLADGSPSPANGFKPNIERLTENTIKYLSE